MTLTSINYSKNMQKILLDALFFEISDYLKERIHDQLIIKMVNIAIYYIEIFKPCLTIDYDLGS